MIGQTISHYKILEKLGEGGMGVVYKATDTQLNRTVAIKFLPDRVQKDPNAKARFLQEAQAAAALNHTNICTIHGVEEYEGNLFIVMEFVDGGTLREKLPFAKVDDALRIGVQVGEALHEAHAKGIVHRDIKADNVMLTSKGQAKVMDFGLAKLRGGLDLTKTATTVGTIGYMSPEQIQGMEVDQRSDIWSFGVVLYEMLTGRLPFRGDHDAAIMYSIVNEDPRPVGKLRSEVSQDLRNIIAKALEKNRDHRYGTMHELLADLQTAGSSSHASGAYVSPSLRLSFAPSKKQMMIAGVVLLIVLLGISGVLFLKPGNEPIDSIAVLPFENVGGNPDVEYLSDGITEDLINSLSKISALRVVPRSTVFIYKGKAGDPQSIGRELKVRAVLTGRVVQRADNLNVQTDLIDINRQAEVWGEQYNEKMADLIALQEQIAKQISEKLQVHLSGEEKKSLTKRYTENTEAYQLYLRGTFYIKRATPEDLEKGLSLFHQALALDPNFALPYVGIAYYYMIQTDFSMVPSVAMPELKKASSKALSLDGELADAETMDGFYDLWYTWNWPGAEKHAREAVRLDPNNYFPHFYYSWYLLSQGDSTQALEEAKRYLELEPLSAEENGIYAHGLYYAHRYDEAFNHIQKNFDLIKDYPFTYLILSWCYLRQQKFPEAIAAAQKMYEIFPVPWTRARLAYVYARTGERSKALALLDTLREESKHVYVASDIVASVYTALGEKDRAFEYLDKGFRERAGWMIFLKVDPIWDPLRSDPRFSALLKKMNLE